MDAVTARQKLRKRQPGRIFHGDRQLPKIGNGGKTDTAKKGAGFLGCC